MDKFIVFAQNQSLFAIDLTTVREVLFLSEQQITPVPNTLPFLLGLTNLRGEILAVADFGRSIGTESTNRSHPQSRILVLEAPDPRDVKLPVMKVGLAVSGVEGVQAINAENIVSAEEVSAELAPLLRGLYNLQGRLLMIVDVEAIANSDRW